LKLLEYQQAIAALTDFPKAAASGRVITIPFGF